MTGARRHVAPDSPDLPHAACAGHANLFHPPVGQYREHQADALARATKAKAICHTCPHLLACRRWALDNPYLAGDVIHNPPVGTIWGGLTEQDRLTIRRRKRTVGAMFADAKTPQPHGTDARYRRHLRDGEPVCPACRAAHTVATNEFRRKPTHGTQAAYRAHLRDGETPCDDCRAANDRDTDRQRQRRAARRALTVTPPSAYSDRRPQHAGEAQ